MFRTNEICYKMLINIYVLLFSGNIFSEYLFNCSRLSSALNVQRGRFKMASIASF